MRGDDVAALLEVAGPRPEEAAVRERVKVSVHARWRTRVRARTIRRRWFLAAHLSAAALGAAVIVSLWPLDGRLAPGPRPPAPAPVVARVDAASGDGLTLAGTGAVQGARLAVGDLVRAGASLTTGTGGRAALLTPDGVSIRVGEGAQLRLVSPSELVLDAGRIYIDNPPKRDRDVRVALRTPLGLVRDTGTQFEGALDDGWLRLRVREGAVSLEKAARTEIAAAGTELRAGPDGQVERRPFPTHGSEWAWTTGLAPAIDIDGRPLGEFLSWLTREMGWRLVYADDALAAVAPATVVHGSIAGLTPEEARATVLAICGLTSHLDDGTLVIADARTERR